MSKNEERTVHGLLTLSVVCLLVTSGCDSEDAGTFEATPEKYPSPPEDDAIDLSVPPDAILTNEAYIDVGEGEIRRFVFTKEAGMHYTIGLSGLSGDLDMYGHWIPDVTLSNYQFSSWAFGRVDEQIDFTATTDGEYFLAIHGYESGDGLLQIFVSAPTEPSGDDDEVIWPVDWGSDAASDAELLGGGLRYLQTYDYGGSCGKTPHPGIDMNHGNSAYADQGLPVMAVADGFVSGAGYSAKGWGNVVTIEHTLSDQTHFESLYGHLGDYSVAVGEEVRKGDVIGTVGKPPATSSPHLHFEIRRNSSLGTFAFPCSWGAYSVEEAYDDPAEFIRAH